MKKLFIYYSLTGNGDAVADYLKNSGYDIRKIETLEPLPDNNVLRILAGGYKAMINYEDKLYDWEKNIEEYDEICVGSPIWNSRISSPINTVLKSVHLENKKPTFILYSGSGKAAKATKSLCEKYAICNIIHLKEPAKNKEELDKLRLK